MKVCDVMERDVKTCGPDDTLESVALLMWNHDCGAVPVVDQSANPLGIITDRDITMSCALNHKALWELSTKEVTNNRPLYTCGENDNMSSALKTMQAQRIRRLPVIDKSGCLKGIVSIDDVVACSEEKTLGMSFKDTMNTLKTVCIHH